MTYAYGEQYLDDAMNNLGEAIDYAVYACHISADDFMSMFVTSGYAKQFESGVAKVVSGLSGSELVIAVCKAVGKEIDAPLARLEYDCSPEYWCGYILAYYQWHSAIPFKDILKAIPMTELDRMYSALHEASEEKAIEIFDSIMKRKNVATKLQTMRKHSGLSQKQLADKSGISLRSIQQYEQRAKDINKAAVDSLLALAKTLGCRVEDLIESV